MEYVVEIVNTHQVKSHIRSTRTGDYIKIKGTDFINWLVYRTSEAHIHTLRSRTMQNFYDSSNRVLIPFDLFTAACELCRLLRKIGLCSDFWAALPLSIQIYYNNPANLKIRPAHTLNCPRPLGILPLPTLHPARTRLLHWIHPCWVVL